MNIIDRQTIIKNNYPLYGTVYCAKLLNLSVSTIRLELRNLNIPRNTRKSHREQNTLNVNADDFINFSTPEHAYILGLLWADGHVSNNNGICLEMIYEDLITLTDVFLKTGKWSINSRHRKKQGMNYSKSLRYRTGNKKLVDFLIKMGFSNKSVCSPVCVLNQIPQNLHPYFFRGWTDGDGCFYNNKKYHTKKLTIAGSFNQDWTALTDLFKRLNIKTYKIRKDQMKKPRRNSLIYGSDSIIYIANKEGIDKFGNYIYGNCFDGIGLKRKYEKFCEIRDHIPEKSGPKPKSKSII